MSAIIDFLLNQQLIKQKQAQQAQDYHGLIGAMFQGQAPDAVNITPQMQAPNQLLLPNGQQPPQDTVQSRDAAGAYNPIGGAAPLMGGPQGQQMGSLFSSMGAQNGMPLLLQMAQQQLGAKAPQTVGKDSRLVVPDGQGGFKVALDAATPEPDFSGAPFQGVGPDGKPHMFIKDAHSGKVQQLDAGVAPKINFVNGQAVDENNTVPGTVIPQQAPQPSAGLSPDAEAQRIRIEAAAIKAREDAAAAKAETGIPDEPALRLMATQWLNGDRGSATGMSRNAQAQTAFRNMLAKVGAERGMSATDISNNLQTFAGSGKAVNAFDTGKQGDTVRSLNVAIQHLNTLDKLTDALDNGDVQSINAITNTFKTQFGSTAPTNFNAAKAIVGDEIIKAIVGGGGALADRENAQNQISSANTPAQLKAVVKTYKELMAGQLHGLRKQYETATSRKDFADKLFPETVSELDGLSQPKNAPGGGTVPTATGPNGQKLYLRDGKWVAQ